MGQAVGGILPLAIGVAISVLPIIAIILDADHAAGARRRARVRGRLTALDTFGSGQALGLGAALSGVNPKNLVLTIGAAASIAQAGLPGAQQAGVLAVFIVPGSITVAAPLVVYLAMGARAAGILAGWRTWLGGHDAAIMLVLFLVFGTLLAGQGIAGLS